MDKKTFLATYAPEVQKAVAGTGLFASVKLAQLALETGWGDSIKTAANNCFGIKAGPNWPGKVVSNTTTEEIDRVRKKFIGTGLVYENYAEAVATGVHVYTLFRAYNSIAESIADHSALLLTAGRYKAARMATDPYKQADAIQRAGYATAGNYAATLKSIIKTNELYKYDNAQ